MNPKKKRSLEEELADIDDEIEKSDQFLAGQSSRDEAVQQVKAKLKRFDRQKGDVRHTRARLDEARRKLGYAPKFGLEAGLAAEWEWILSLKD